jgi:hypothetical protein
LIFPVVIVVPLAPSTIIKLAYLSTGGSRCKLDYSTTYYGTLRDSPLPDIVR